ncbi:hypothetical protein BFW38_13380 [Terasakiispira papahanaumokuakeensis]|uniref:Glucose/Sorbosone dehydrogenase domain-containing protein n=1 Tax=Terasakiispira papahanaumokuakeensis TaxID=197479 RepID=A0A1E2VCJ6_9GAMM|nr:PQQ-dependent sugar dehydrogenase [Terasakiispira papahanaumokuakeensis]ODC04375.1 hypothetical protein BFW38_13380 [Terasakiispira papahanaumokuakeensis]
MKRIWVAVCFSIGLISQTETALARTLKTSVGSLQVTVMADGLAFPWALVVLPDGEALISERAGRLRRWQRGQLLEAPVKGLPAVAAVGQGGLLDLALHPDFIHNRWLYFSYVEQQAGRYTTVLARGRYHAGRLSEVERLFHAEPYVSTQHHFGGRIAFDHDAHVYLTVGDRGQRDWAQQLTRHPGSVIRLLDDGQVPDDNPFVGQRGARPEIFSYGHRNPQGLAVDHATGTLWLSEHGPRGGDEVNRLVAGGNYGWPLVTYGREYSGAEITETRQRPGMIDPKWQWTPSIAPSGLIQYQSHLIPEWQGDWLSGALKAKMLVRLTATMDNTALEAVEQIPIQQRVRSLYEAPDGALWILTDSGSGQWLSLSPEP